MIEISSKFQSRRFVEDTFGFGTFGWTPIGKVELSYLIHHMIYKLVEVDGFNIKVIGTSRYQKKFTGLWRARNNWSKAQGGSKNVFVDPNTRDDSIMVITNSILESASNITRSVDPVLYLETTLATALRRELDQEIKSILEKNNITIICN